MEGKKNNIRFVIIIHHLVRSGWELFVNRALLCSDEQKGSLVISVDI